MNNTFLLFSKVQVFKVLVPGTWDKGQKASLYNTESLGDPS